MSYESRVYVMERNTIKPSMSMGLSGNKEGYIIASPIASFDMCAMNPSFKELFDMPIDFDMWGDNDADLTEDKYGEKVKYTHIAPVIEYLEEEIRESNYRRLQPFLAFLRGIDEGEWDEIILVHYGY